MLTPEQKELVEQYRYVPAWLIGKKLTLRSPLVRRLLQKYGSFDDLVAELHIKVIEAVKSYKPDKGATLKSWIITVCHLQMFSLARYTRQQNLDFKLKTNWESDCSYNETEEKVIEIPYHVLTPKEQDIIKRRFSENKETLDETGRSYQISRERVRQIERTALRKLKQWYAYKRD